MKILAHLGILVLLVSSILAQEESQRIAPRQRPHQRRLKKVQQNTQDEIQDTAEAQYPNIPQQFNNPNNFNNRKYQPQDFGKFGPQNGGSDFGKFGAQNGGDFKFANPPVPSPTPAAPHYSATPPFPQQNQQYQQNQRNQQNQQNQRNEPDQQNPVTSAPGRLDFVTPIPIIRFDKVQSNDGSYKASYETGNNIVAEETGFLKNVGIKDEEALVQHGSYSYTAPDGSLITVTYTADEGGFRAEGAHLPTPPPVPPEIQKSLDIIYEQIRLDAEREARGEKRPDYNQDGDNYPTQIKLRK
uniref:Cuticular protein n=1 Tax=Nilaparvata lugens TaxID=108931 RepID=A0A2S1ZS78_NILLU|nr:cuticular protein [Nilaparvata lugens]